MSRAKECRPGRGRCRERRELADTAGVLWIGTNADGSGRHTGGDWWIINYPLAAYDFVAVVSFCPWCGRPLGGAP